LINLAKNNCQDIGKRLKQARLDADLSIPDVAAQTKKSTGNISELENGKYLPSTKALLLLSDIYKVSIDWLLTGRADAEIPSRENAPPFIPDQELRPYFEKINQLLDMEPTDQQHMRGWIIIQLKKAFPEIEAEMTKED
jgi:transcriptional regulator with XRE-family HTH domain